MPTLKIRDPASCPPIERTQMTVRARIPSKGETALRFLNVIEISAMNGSRCICKSHCRTSDGLTSQLAAEEGSLDIETRIGLNRRFCT